MKRLFFALIFLIFCICACTGEKEYKALYGRFEGYLKAVIGMNIDSIQAYTYPKLFTILPGNESRETMVKPYSLMKEIVELDSMKIDTIFPVFHIDKGSYAQANYSVLIRMRSDPTEVNTDKISFGPATKKHSNDPTTLEHSIGEKYPAPQITLMTTLIRGQYGIKVLSYQVKDGMRIIKGRIMTIAVKDEFAKDWSFFTVTNDQELINKLFPKKVLEKMTSKD